MRFLADMGVSPLTVAALRADEIDVVHLFERGLERTPDEEIVALARNERRVVLTFDVDFGEIMALGQLVVPSIIIFRLKHGSPDAVTRRIRQILGSHESDIEQGSIVVVRDSSHRVRRLPLSRDRDDVE